MKITKIISNAIKTKTTLDFNFDFLASDIHKPGSEAKEIIGVRVALMNAGISADFETGHSKRLGQLVKPFKDWMFPDDAADLKYALGIGHFPAPVVYSKEFDAIGIILSPKKIIESAISDPKDFRYFAGTTDNGIILLPDDINDDLMT